MSSLTRKRKSARDRGARSRQRPGKRERKEGMKNATMQIVKSPYVGGVPDELDVTLRYVETINLSTTVAQAGYVFRGNDTFDPNFTGTGLQPAFRDNWAALFAVQQVVSSTITVKPFHDISTGSVPGVCIVAPSQTSTLNDIDYVRSLPKSQSRPLNFYTPPRPIRITSASSQLLAVELVRNQGISSALVSASPAAADSWYWLIIQRSADGAGPTTCDYEVTIDYHVHFAERVPANLSMEHAERNRKAFALAQAAKPQGKVYIEIPCKPREKSRPIPEAKLPAKLELAGAGQSSVGKQDQVTRSATQGLEFKQLGFKTVEIKGAGEMKQLQLPLVGASAAEAESTRSRPLSPWSDVDDDDVEVEFFEKFKKYIHNRRAVRGVTAADKQMDAVENCDFSGNPVLKKQ